ncbi:FapA family protein [Alkalihalobacterium chitinilyticum]|uniref:FapA family protein n=1 Tax=Alkalihalobacterium chitinilyticum TaxID=2980103 RepID=A0ABT5VBJ4_9BACI|nr:FapA family protein [Alkalihalobacterium chitinilyticum]MDE5412712.1 FapA family protein [Alkalihalobacterium chitinilyticum]
MNKKQNDIIELIRDIQIENFSKYETIDTTTESEPTEHHILKDDGFIEVRDHQLFIINPNANGRQPVLVPNENIYMTVNGKVLKKEIAVFEKDTIEWTVKIKKPYQITISEDKLNVYLQVFPELFTKYRLKDKKRSLRFKLEVEPCHKPCHVEEVSSKILEDITKYGVKIEVKTSAIMQELMQPTFNRILVAEGLPLIPSRDGFVEKFFKNEVEEVIEEVNGKVDFKNRLKIPIAEAGAVIAQVHPPKEGKEGYNVLGQTLLPKKAKRLDVRAKPAIKITDDGKVIALQQGRPSVTGHYVKHINILETYEVNGDVDMSTGNIFFSGDIIIRGNIKDHMTVESSGSIFVYGSVYHASVTASQHVIILGNVMNSKINAGQFGLFYSRVYKITQDLSLSIKQLWEALKQLQQAMELKGISMDFGYVLSTLVDSKFKNIRDKVFELYKTIQEMAEHQISFPPQLKIILNALAKFKDNQSILSITSEQSLHSIQYAINELMQQMESIILEESNIDFYSATSSQIKTNGKITIKKEGIINTTLFAGKDIVFNRQNAVIRGGKVEALETIKAGIVGTDMGQPPELYAGKKISIEKLHQAKISFPNYNLFIEEPIEEIELIYNSKTNKVKSTKIFYNSN